MEIIHYAVCGRNVRRLGNTLIYVNILQPVYFSVFLHGNFYSEVILVILSYTILYNYTRDHDKTLIHA